MSDSLILPELTYLGTPFPAKRVEGGEGSNRHDQLCRAAMEFEALFIRQMLKAMRSTAKDPLLGDGNAGRVVLSIFDDHLAGTIAQQGGMGFADYIMQGLIGKDAVTGQGGAGDELG